MKIQIIGSGCPACKNLHTTVQDVIKKLNINLKVEYSKDITKVIEFGAMSSPVFAINGQLITAGKIPSDKEIKKAILEKIKK